MIRWLLTTGCLVFSLVSFSQPIKAISFNIRYDNEKDGNNQWSLRKSSVADFIAYENPDFLGLQESLLSQIKDIEVELPEYAWIGKSRDDGKHKGEFSPLFYDSEKWELLESGTFWLSETPGSPSKSWDAGLPRICTWGSFQSNEDESTVFVFNTHFDHVGEEARQKSAKLIAGQIADKTNDQRAILLGDFNALPDSETIQNLRNHSLFDSFSLAEKRFGQEGTYNGFNYKEIPSRRIDYVFVTEDWKVHRYGVASHLIEGRYLSDHFPVIVILGRNE